MIDANNIETVHSIRELFDHIPDKSKHIVFWVGAGASSWCGYPRWPELAEIFHSQYVRYEPAYDAKTGLTLISTKKFPELFQACRDISAQRFYSLIVSSFPAREPTPVYQRFANTLRGVSPSCIITTNVDELLEKQLPGVATVSQFDLQRVVQLLSSDQPFVCKLHGSISDLNSTVFTSEDYHKLLADVSFIPLLERILAATRVIFIGYSLQDDYILSILARNYDIANLFGDGPHYAILPCDYGSLPPNVRVIRYIAEPHKDHRSPITIIEEIRSLKIQEAVADRLTHPITDSPKEIESAHLLYDIYPPGTWEISFTLELRDSSGAENQMIVGTGFSDDELPDNRSTAMHDVLVGLICFDHIYASISSLSRVHDLLGAQRFWRLVQDGVLSFVSWTHQEGIIFPNAGSFSAGELGSISHYKPEMTRRTVAEIVRSQLNPVPGQEEVAERLFDQLSASTREITSIEEGHIPNMVRSLLLRPSIRKLLGVSGGTPLNSLARWNAFPILRLANVVKIGAACRILKAGSAKLNFGTAKLAGPAFAAAIGDEFADDTASYVVSGRFAADLGTAALQDPSLLDSILAFRESRIGEELRKEVFARLLASEGAEVNVAVNSGLRNTIPSAILQRARDNFVNLLTGKRSEGIVTPAIWNDWRYSEDEALQRWRKRSGKVLEDYCRQYNISPYSACPCGSGEKLKFCCGEALSDAR